MSESIVYLLCGLPGSGKTTYAKELEKNGAIRLTLDEEVFHRYGRHFASGYAEKEADTKTYLEQCLDEHIKAGVSVVLDWGFWKRAERERIKELVQRAGAEPKLVYFKQPTDKLQSRIRGRDMATNHDIDDEMMKAFATQFEAPEGEGGVVMTV